MYEDGHVHTMGQAENSVCVCVWDSHLVLVLLHHGELSLQLLQHLKLWGLQTGPVTPQLFQHLKTDGNRTHGSHPERRRGDD